MKFEYRKGDLFKIPREYCFVHCISADFALGKGIAKQFDNIYHMKFKLNNRYGDTPLEERVGQAYLVDNVFNLVTKEQYFQKPTYETLCDCLQDMREKVVQLNIHKIAMPKIECGLNRLRWYTVQQIIKGVFCDLDVEIVVNEFEFKPRGDSVGE